MEIYERAEVLQSLATEVEVGEGTAYSAVADIPAERGEEEERKAHPTKVSLFRPPVEAGTCSNQANHGQTPN